MAPRLRDGGNLDWIQGDGRLLYSGVDGPVSSTRLENLRDAVEDYELLAMLARLAGDDAAAPLARKVGGASIDAPVRDLAGLLATREELAAAIVKHMT